MSDLIQLGGLWRGQTKDGRRYLPGSLGFAKILIFENAHKRPDTNDPDYQMFLAPAEKKNAERPSADDEIPF